MVNYLKKTKPTRILVQKILNQIFSEKHQLQMDKIILQTEIEKYKAWVSFLLRRKEETTNHNIATIINYCTTDYKFIEHCIKEVNKFSSQVIVPISDYFFDGTPENEELLEKTRDENKGVDFIKFEFDPNKPTISARYWHNFSRWIGVKKVKDDIEYVLFLDVDEIIEGDKFLEWLNNFNYKDYDAIMFASYWYFRETKFRALIDEIHGLLVKRNIIKKNLIMVNHEREGTFDKIQGKKITRVTGIDGNPMLHHYSWVRTKEEMLKKVKTWGHNRDRNWIPLVEKEFQREFTENSTDFVFFFRYKIVNPYIKFDE